MDLPDKYASWTRTPEQVAQDLSVDITVGLSSDEAEKRRGRYGYNELKKQPATPLWKLVLEQFDDMLVKILLLAALVSFVLAYFDEESHEEGLRAYIEPFVIVLILILNAFVGVWQESNAEAALEALKELQSETAMVIRNGKLVSDLPAKELVPGDVVELVVGARVPADVRVIKLKTATLRAEQSSLTGEPVAVLKATEPVSDANCELQLKECMLFASTAIANGSCTGIVVNTGMTTEIGKIQEQIQQASEEEEDTPLKKKLDNFGELLAQVIAWICVVVWLINYRQYLSFEVKPGTIIPDWSTVTFSLKNCIYYFKIAVALAVAAIPEGLPAVITTCLALGTRKMAKKNAIVRKLPSVETLGCTTVICSDKTGTLTTNQMSAVHLVTMASATTTRELVVGGHTYNPSEGTVQGISKLDKALEAVAEVCAVCNEAGIEYKNGAYKAVGAPTEAALKVLAEKLGMADVAQGPQLRANRSADPEKHAEAFSNLQAARLKKVAVLEFDRNRKSSSVVCSSPGSKNVLLAKGAAEFVVGRCTHVLTPDGAVVAMSSEARAAILAAIESASSKALRCLALARKTELDVLSDYNGSTQHRAHALLTQPEKYEAIESGMVFVGLAGLLDPARPEVPQAIADCKTAGIRVIVITGDNQNTAEAICRSIGVFNATESIKGKSFIGRQFVEMPKEQQLAALKGKHSLVFSRAEPKHKQDIVRLLKEMGEVTAMTGDGVNDAPALKLADIGIAMGIAGTEVAKEASDMVLADDNFSTIVAAVGEGRAIYNNMKAFIRYMISSNIGEVASIFFTAALGLPENLIPVQLLWVNLVTDGPPATALGFNPPDLDIMTKPPRRSDDNLITPWVFFRYMVIGCYVGFATVGAFASWYLFDSFLGIDLSLDGHSTVTWHQLTHWQQCREWKDFQATSYTAGDMVVSFDHPCDYFTDGKAKASTLALTVIVAIEMFNALNALSEDNSLLQMPPWCNPWLLVAMMLSIAFHCVILYVPFLADIFSIVPLSFNEWLLVILYSFPVIIIDEVLKLVGRTFFGVHTKVAAKPKQE